MWSSCLSAGVCARLVAPNDTEEGKAVANTQEVAVENNNRRSDFEQKNPTE